MVARRLKIYRYLSGWEFSSHRRRNRNDPLDAECQQQRDHPAGVASARQLDCLYLGCVDGECRPRIGLAAALARGAVARWKVGDVFRRGRAAELQTGRAGPVSDLLRRSRPGPNRNPHPCRISQAAAKFPVVEFRGVRVSSVGEQDTLDNDPNDGRLTDLQDLIDANVFSLLPSWIDAL